MPQFIRYMDIEDDSHVIVNKDQIQDVRVKKTERHGSEHYQITFINGKTINVREPKPVMNSHLKEPLFSLNKN